MKEFALKIILACGRNCGMYNMVSSSNTQCHVDELKGLSHKNVLTISTQIEGGEEVREGVKKMGDKGWREERLE